MIPTKKQMQIISRHFNGDVDMLIETAKRVDILDPCTFLQLAADAGLDTKGAVAMMFAGRDNPNDVVDSYSRIVSSSEAISQTRGTKNWGVFDTDRVIQEMRKLLQRDQNARDGKGKQKDEI